MPYSPTYGIFSRVYPEGVLAKGSQVRGQSWSVTPIELLGEEKVDHGIHGTGFFYQRGGTSYLITNWHNVAGLNPFTYENMHARNFVPKFARIYVPLVHDGNIYYGMPRSPIDLTLYENFDEPLWLEHESFADVRVDIVAMKLPVSLPKEMHVNGHDSHDLVNFVGDDVFIVGYPFKNYVGSMPPIWKRGSFASDPGLPVDDRPMFLIDAASRPGMSGSPIFRHKLGPATDKQWNVHAANIVTTQFIGVYSGHLQSDYNEVTLGFGWSGDLVDEILATPHRPTRQ